ncbi:hypothetical protein Skr01_54610 [Sphaerisporangium krabiense]|uniref:Uncharacterized protein n=1 Tax=Sphaerisporangium krabiense TaxID=763782 RepID=A0A7W8Z4E9_9ACTN|nr:hypothetical protein [Sphaerisporangium krabiense]MBB5627215.1 hypothetical protein [Sphaerisporangium krabiense]GII65376.1 hypothetical protein Skr01_54610 [Sphaerisporangium krabiense]
MAGKRKQVAAQHTTPAKGAKPFVRSAVVLPGEDGSDKRLSWRFCHVDRDGPWSFDKVDAGTMHEVLDKLAHFETMTVNEIFNHGEEPGKHYDVADLPNPTSRERLAELHLTDMTKISRLRLGGTLRLYGFLQGNCFHIIWWDPDHEIWPSHKRNT